MAYETLYSMEEYLKPSKMVDSASPIVVQTLNKLAGDIKTPKEIALKLFKFVRDEIIYTRISLYTKASEVITKRQGNCTNKSVAYTAMLRAAGIPARLHYYSIRKEAVKALIHPRLYPILPKIVEINARCDIFFDGHWVTVETELDPMLYKGMLEKGLISPAVNIDWDGEHSTTFLDEYNVEDLGSYVDPEKVIDSFMYRQLSPFKRAIYPLNSRLSNSFMDGHRKAAMEK